MKVIVKRMDKSLPIPKIQTKDSVGFDFYAKEETLIKPFEIKLVPLNLIIKVPKNCGLFIFSRSSVPFKKGLIVANGVGVVDPDYHGKDDEVMVSLLNITRKKVVVEKGERIAQGVFIKFLKPVFRETEKMSKKSRGGFGSTGQR